MSAELEDLQVRFTHQEAAIEALSATIAHQAGQINALRDQLERVKHELRELQPSPLGHDAGDEPPPPHY